MKLSTLIAYYKSRSSTLASHFSPHRKQEIDVTRRERKSIAQLLDKLVPLTGASHSDVVDYKVTVPIRYAEVHARLTNGQIARLSEPRKSLGWLGYGSNPTLLFGCGDQRVVVETGNQQNMIARKFITPDGGQLTLQA